MGNPDLHCLPRTFGTNGFHSKYTEVPPFVHKSLLANLFHCQVATFARGKTFFVAAWAGCQRERGDAKVEATQGFNSQ